MIVTVEQAKTKQCRAVPLVLMPKVTASSIIGKQQEMQWQTTTCVGPDCMAWQWENTWDGVKAGVSDTRGFCGYVR